MIISITGGDDMRLMEVDEAASHIKELVDPDANIIWGSAFNNDLDGKIRVSVVATGIEAEAGTQGQGSSASAAKVFTFPGRATGAPVPPKAAVAPEPLFDTTEDDDTLELGTDEDSEELLLDNDDILTSPVTSAPIAPPTDEELAGNEVPTPAPAREGGTLFERMSNIARGAAQAKVDEEDSGTGRREPLDIPRFLNRQNNQ